MRVTMLCLSAESSSTDGSKNLARRCGLSRHVAGCVSG